MDIKDILKGETTRERAVNFIQLAKNIVEDYKYGMPHGVQKDALQNGWDAVDGPATRNNVSSNWGFEFELTTTSSGVKIFTLTDKGTTGLTGNMTSKDEYSAESLPQDEKWARWESLAFAKSGKSDLGARGQGKMVFIVASKDHCIFYDSLRKDGTYRFGGTQATDRGCPVFHHDGDEGKRKLKDMLGLEPIENKGTRVIIYNPSDELIQTVESGEFLSFIEETWWPLILKFEAKITLKYGDFEKTAQVPDFFPIAENLKETETFRTWIVDNKKIKSLGSEYKIKHIKIAYNENEEKPERFQGIACFRGGMKVATIDFPILRLRPHVFGYVEFEDTVDEKLREVEEPNHYNFQNKGIWPSIRRAVEEENEAFGNKKLGLGVSIQAKEADKRSEAEVEALALLRLLTKGWSLGSHGHGVNPTEPGVEPPSIKEVGLKLHKFLFPNEANIPKLSYGEAVSAFECEAFNKTTEELKVNFKLLILSENRIVSELANVNNLLKEDSSLTYGPYDLKVDEKNFPDKGEYKLRLILSDVNTKERLDELTRKFWVESEPSLPAPFDVRGMQFSLIPNIKDVEKLEWILESEGDGKYTLYYNIEHPVYRTYDSDTKSLAMYLAEIFYQGAIELVVRRASRVEKEAGKDGMIGPFESETLRTQNLLKFFQEASAINSKARYTIFKD
jgi:hypothetical protein